MIVMFIEIIFSYQYGFQKETHEINKYGICQINDKIKCSNI